MNPDYSKSRLEFDVHDSQNGKTKDQFKNHGHGSEVQLNSVMTDVKGPLNVIYHGRISVIAKIRNKRK